jgi:hypothetical protein
MQPLPGCAPEGGDAMRLTYAVELRPSLPVPVALLEAKIATDLANNLKVGTGSSHYQVPQPACSPHHTHTHLKAIRSYTEAQAAAKRLSSE